MEIPSTMHLESRSNGHWVLTQSTLLWSYHSCDAVTVHMGWAERHVNGTASAHAVKFVFAVHESVHCVCMSGHSKTHETTGSEGWDQSCGQQTFWPCLEECPFFGLYLHCPRCLRCPHCPRFLRCLRCPHCPRHLHSPHSPHSPRSPHSCCFCRNRCISVCRASSCSSCCLCIETQCSEHVPLLRVPLFQFPVPCMPCMLPCAATRVASPMCNLKAA